MSGWKIAASVVLSLVLVVVVGALGLDLLRPPQPSTVEPIQLQGTENQSAQDQGADAGLESSEPATQEAQPVRPRPPAKAGDDDDDLNDPYDDADEDDDSSD